MWRNDKLYCLFFTASNYLIEYMLKKYLKLGQIVEFKHTSKKQAVFISTLTLYRLRTKCIDKS